MPDEHVFVEFHKIAGLWLFSLIPTRSRPWSLLFKLHLNINCTLVFIHLYRRIHVWNRLKYFYLISKYINTQIISLSGILLKDWLAHNHVVCQLKHFHCHQHGQQADPQFHWPVAFLQCLFPWQRLVPVIYLIVNRKRYGYQNYSQQIKHVEFGMPDSQILVSSRLQFCQTEINKVLKLDEACTWSRLS